MAAMPDRYLGGAKEFSALLRRLRTAAGLTQVQLAEQSGYYVNYVRKLERGERRPSRQVTLALARALQLESTDRLQFEQAAGNRTLVQPSLKGREHELTVLERVVDDGGRGLTMISGGPGSGKTRLLATARKLADERRVMVLEAVCHGQGASEFAPFREALERPLWRLEPGDRMRVLTGCERLSELIAESIGVSCLPRHLLSPGQELQFLFEAVTTFLPRIARDRTLVIEFDDLHRADEGALSLLGRLLRAPDLPLSVIGTCQETGPDANEALGSALDEWVGAGLAQKLVLQPLTVPEAESVLDEMLGDGITQEQRVWLVKKSNRMPGELVALAYQSLAEPLVDEDERAHSDVQVTPLEPAGWAAGVTPVSDQDWCAG